MHMTNEFRKAIGQHIRQRRKALHLTQEATAEQLGISVKHFSEAERGIAGLSVENLAKLSDLLGCSLDHLVKGALPVDTALQGCLSVLLHAVPREKEDAVEALLRAAVRLANDTAAPGR